MRLAIADPPYLGRAALWYGGKGRNKQGYAGRACGRGDLAPEYHPDASLWDDPDEHTRLAHRLDREYDGWALAASAKTLTQIRIPDRARIAVWHVTNAIPDGSRIRATWEAVIVRFDRAGGRCECEGECGRGTHDGRCPNRHGVPAYGTGSTVVLTVAHLCHTPECRDHVKAMCQGCHLHYDRDHHAQTRSETRVREQAALYDTALIEGEL